MPFQVFCFCKVERDKPALRLDDLSSHRRMSFDYTLRGFSGFCVYFLFSIGKNGEESRERLRNCRVKNFSMCVRIIRCFFFKGGDNKGL